MWERKKVSLMALVNDYIRYTPGTLRLDRLRDTEMAETIVTSVSIRWDEMSERARLAILNKELLASGYHVNNLEAQLPLEERVMLERARNLSDIHEPDLRSISSPTEASNQDGSSVTQPIIAAELEAGTNFSFISTFPKAQSSMYVQGKKAAQNGGLAFRLCHKKPNWFIRLWHKVFFGFEWEDYHE